jgi:hypothetical protein
MLTPPKNIEYPKLGIIFQLDTNRINTRGNEAAITELEKLAELGVIELEWSNAVYDELSEDAPNGRNWRKANKRLVAHAAITTSEERQKLREIENIVFPGGVLNQNEKMICLHYLQHGSISQFSSLTMDSAENRGKS